MSKFTAAAQDFASYAREHGFTYSFSSGVVKVEKRITPNDPASFANAEMCSSTLLSKAPTTAAGSIWGTDGGSIGGMTALKTGYFTMNKSGVSKRFISALMKSY